MKKFIQKSRFSALTLVIFMSFMTITGCGNSGNDKSKEGNSETQLEIEQIDLEVEKIDEKATDQIRIGVMEKGSEELLNHAKTILEENEYDLEVLMYQDADEMNQDLLDGKLDAHLFAHQPYMNSYHFQKGEDLQSLGVLYYEKYGIFPLLKDDLTKINQAATVAIPKESIPQARALLFLQELGYIVLKDGLEERTSLNDIIENPSEILFVEYSVDDLMKEDSSTVDRFALKNLEADFIVSGSYLAAIKGIDVLKEVLVTENMEMEGVQLLGTQLVSRKDNLNSEKLKALKAAFQSKGMQDYLQYMLKGTVGTK